MKATLTKINGKWMHELFKEIIEQLLPKHKCLIGFANEDERQAVIGSLKNHYSVVSYWITEFPIDENGCIIIDTDVSFNGAGLGSSFSNITKLAQMVHKKLDDWYKYAITRSNILLFLSKTYCTQSSIIDGVSQVSFYGGSSFCLKMDHVYIIDGVTIYAENGDKMDWNDFINEFKEQKRANNSKKSEWV